MHDDIIEHISDDAGYNRGFDAGMKRAWSLLGELAEFYKNNIIPHRDSSQEEKKRFGEDIQKQVNALHYGRFIIQKGSMGDEGLDNMTKDKDE